MADGVIKKLFPPGNTGKDTGTGKILSEGTTYSFVTPTANGGKVLEVDKPCNFTLEGNEVVSVWQNL